jgi:hypothetical protein
MRYFVYGRFSNYARYIASNKNLTINDEYISRTGLDCDKNTRCISASRPDRFIEEKEPPVLIG